MLYQNGKHQIFNIYMKIMSSS